MVEALANAALAALLPTASLASAACCTIDCLSRATFALSCRKSSREAVRTGRRRSASVGGRKGGRSLQSACARAASREYHLCSL
mmetsp:Transcript_24431/g.78488  ORF Transcript_24431/g.78488 Transcript_24431/m.78488 type:complete len:84 (-) Transcript_24431:119-370(-)